MNMTNEGVPPYQQHVCCNYAKSMRHLTVTISRNVEYHAGNIFDRSIAIFEVQVLSKILKSPLLTAACFSQTNMADTCDVDSHENEKGNVDFFQE